MMRVEFNQITIEHFKEFRTKQTINFARLGSGVHFVSGINEVEPRLGSNGAGKSTIFDALTWCLFGQTVSGLRGTDIRTWGSKAHALVSVIVVVNDAPFVIARSTKTNGRWIDDRVVEQAEIDRLLGLTITNFPHTLLLGQGAPLFFDLNRVDKMRLLSETLDLDRWEERSKAAAKAVQAFAGDMQAAEARAEELARTKAGAITALADLRTKSTGWEEERATREAERGKSIAKLEKQLVVEERQRGEYDLAHDSAETELRALKEKQARSTKALIAASKVVGEAVANLRTVGRDLIDLRDQMPVGGDDCPTCGQSLKGTALQKHRNAVVKRITELETEEKAAKKAETAAIKARDTLDVEAAQIAKHIAAFNTKSDEAKDNHTRAERRVSEINAELKSLRTASAAGDDERNPYSPLIKKARGQVDTIKGLIDENEALLRIIEKKRDRTQYWVKGFKQVRLYLLQEVLEELQGVTQTLLPQIGLDDWLCEFAMERETQAGKVSPGLNVNIYKPGSDVQVKWESWSGGEGQRLRLIGAIALSQVLLRRAGVECDMLILDEPTRHLSPEGVAETIDFLIDLGVDHQVFYVDHTAQNNRRFASTLIVRRDEHGAKISRA